MPTQLLISESFVEKYERSSHAVGISMWHFEWCTKYRYKMFDKQKYLNLITACIRRAGSMHEIKFMELEVLSDHVHCAVKLPSTMSPSKALQILKGASAYLFFKFHERARLRYPKGHLWSRGRFYTSVGFIQVGKMNEYVRNQRQHHGLGSPTL